MSNSIEYNRRYAKENRKEILRKRRERYWTDPVYRDKILAQARKRRATQKKLRLRNMAEELGEDSFRIIIYRGKKMKIFNKAGLARLVGVTRPTIDNWHRDGVLPVPPDVDELGRFWYREDYVGKLRQALGIYKVNLRKEVLAERIKRAFSGGDYEREK